MGLSLGTQPLTTPSVEGWKGRLLRPRRDAFITGEHLNCLRLTVTDLILLFASAAWAHGDAKKLAYTTDSNGDFCGQKNTRNEKKNNLFYFNILKCASPTVLTSFQCPTRQFCVSVCPDRFLTFIDVQKKHRVDRSSWEYYRQYCKPGFNDPLKPVSEVFRNEDCPSFILPSRSFLKRCFPDLSTINGILALKNRTTFIDGTGSTRNIADLQKGIWICYREYKRLLSKPGTGDTFYEIGFHSDLRVYLQLRQTWLAFTIMLCILEVCILLAILFLRKRIQIAVALLKEGSRTIGYIPCSLLYPLVTFFLISICISYWIVIAVFLATSGKAVFKVLNVGTNCKYANETCDPQTFYSTNISKECPGAGCHFAFYGGKSIFYEYILIFQIFNAFVFLWLVNFSIALGQCTLAGAFASYYWAFQKPKDIPSHPLSASFGCALRYHTGSLAFGSLILTIVQILRVMLEYLNHKLKDSKSKSAKFILCCFKCCFWCLEKVLKFINRNAYIMIAIYGENFCTAARNAFTLIMRNVVRVAVLDKVTEFLLCMGKLLISTSMGILGFLFFTKKLPVTPPTLNYYWVPLLMIIFGSYLIAHGFFSVFAMCVDTLFLCFCKYLAPASLLTLYPLCHCLLFHSMSEPQTE
uniref:Choline transporter-like protein n=1 Tax=Vombatus ursinus TaxID=29139 RepID=A0A4X2L4M9_VOMUR